MKSQTRRPLVMGVLNVTPDSFSDGGRFATVRSATARAIEMLKQGADLIDIGGESTRPGAQRVTEFEQIRRVVPVIRKIIAKQRDALISIDTTRATVAAAALDVGAAIINDISAGRDDPAIFALAAQRKAPLVLMHMQGQPATMQEHPTYKDVVREVTAFLKKQIAVARKSGVEKSQILIDPGIGFGKGFEHNLRLLKNLSALTRLGYPMLVGTSRKRFIGTITGKAEPRDRLAGSMAAVAWSVANGADIVRVHDVAEMVDVVKIIAAIRGVQT